MARRQKPGRHLKLAGALLLVVSLALLPAYGDTVPGSAVTHPEWARMVLQGLDLLDARDALSGSASLVFATLSGKDSRSWSAERYTRSNRVEAVSLDRDRVVRPTDVVGEAVYSLAVARGGDYRLRLRVAGPSPAEAELATMGEDEILRSFVVPTQPVMGWTEVGSVHLDPGAYEASVLLPEGATLAHVELAPPCLRPIEPEGGWRPTAIATTEDVAVTVIQAVDLEDQLPPAAAPLEYRGTDLRIEEGLPGTDEGDIDGAFRAGARGGRVVLLADIPTDGLYTLSVFGVSPGGQRWLADGCRKALVCPSTALTPQWRVVLSDHLVAGRHYFEASVGPGAIVEKIRFERKKDTSSDYLGTLRRLGLDLGPEGPITRDRAEEARRFIEQRGGEREAALCGDILLPGSLVAELTAAAGGGPAAGPGGAQGGDGGNAGDGGDGGPGVPPPVVPPLPPGSPVLPTAFSGD